LFVVLGIIVIAFGLVFWQKEKLFSQAAYCGYRSVKIRVVVPGGTPVKNAYVTASSTGCVSISRYTNATGDVQFNVPFSESTLSAHISAVKPGPLISSKCHLKGSTDINPGEGSTHIVVTPTPPGCPTNLIYY
jgi:hypothetical protein